MSYILPTNHVELRNRSQCRDICIVIVSVGSVLAISAVLMVCVIILVM
jgi:hypothetical protein